MKKKILIEWIADIKEMIMTGFMLFASCFVEAATCYVSSEGANASPYATWETAATDIAAALSIVEDGDVICIDSSTTFRPTEALKVSKGVTLCGRDRTTDDVATATFDGSEFTGSQRFLDFSNSTVAPKIMNLAFRNFAAGALSFTSVTGAEIADCVFTDNGGDGVQDGGAVFFSQCADATVVRSAFDGNVATRYGGAVCFYATKNGLSGAILDCTFTGKANAAYGKCIYMSAGSMTECRFTGVTCERNGSNGDFGMICMSGGTLMNCKVGGSYLYTRFLQVQGGTTPVQVRNLLLSEDNTMHPAFTLVGTYNGRGAVFGNCTILIPGQLLFASSTSQSPQYGFSNCALAGEWPTEPGLVTCTSNGCTDPAGSIDDMKFVDRASGNYIPRSDSPLIDVAEPLDWQTAESVDIGGRPRVVGEKVDLGCYERQATDVDYHDKRVVATESEKIGEWAGAYVGLQAAIDSVSNAMTRLLVKSGTYQIGETIQITNVSLAVVSCGADGKPDRDGTILDGQGVRRILRIVPSTLDATTFLPTTDARVTFEGFTFRNGVTHAGDGQFDAGMGGGVYFSGRSMVKGKSPSQIVNCRFSNCEADFGGAVAMEGGELVNCTFDGNKADIDEDETATSAIGGQGGAVGVIMRSGLSQRTAVCLSRDATWVAPGIVGCTFTGNTAEASGAAISVYQKRVDGFGIGSAYVADCSFEGNALTWPTDKRDYSEGVCVSVCYNGLVTNCLFRANGTSTIGYGVVMMDGVGQMVDCTLAANDSVYGSVYGASADAVFERCKFGNKRYVRAAGTFRNCLFMATTGYLIHAVAADATYDNCTFIVSEASRMAYFPANRTNRLAFNNCILYWSNWLSPLEMDCKSYALSFASCCISKEPTDKANMTFDNGCLLNVDPRFVDAAAQDYALKLRSPCVDRGLLLDWMTADSVDLSGNVRVLNNGKTLSDDANALPDMGCFEMQDAKRGSRMILR